MLADVFGSLRLPLMQVAARMVSAFTTYKQFDQGRQALMRKQVGCTRLHRVMRGACVQGGRGLCGAALLALLFPHIVLA